MLCPQHGAIYRGPDVGRFINWFAGLPIGVLRAGPR
jgi:flavorubredoxin